MANVSRENLRKVENYFVEQVRSLGTKSVEMTVVDIADGSNVALATAHRAIKELAQHGVITIVKPSSRRFPITYIYQNDIEDFKVSEGKDGQIEFLKARVAYLEEKVKSKGLQNV